MKPAYVSLKLAGHWFALPFVCGENNKFLSFGVKENAILFSRAEAVRVLRRVRSWKGGRGYYRLEVVA